MSAYYNEFDPYAAQWLRNLIAAGHIAPGEVDERSILEVKPEDLRGFTQCHFFAGIGVWSHALRTAGFPDDRPVWTGSCPCQPFSAAGKGDEFADERHLWPAWFRLIRECRPESIFGEQVASKDALAWLDHVSTDLEGEGYTFGAVDTCAAGFGAPHIRQRLYFVADSAGRRQTWRDGESGRKQSRSTVDGLGPTSELADAERAKSARLGQHSRKELRQQETEGFGESRGTNGFWSDAIWLPCRDGKARPTQPGIFPLAHGAAQRVGRLRAYGNAICAPQAAEFIKAYLDASH